AAPRAAVPARPRSHRAACIRLIERPLMALFNAHGAPPPCAAAPRLEDSLVAAAAGASHKSAATANRSAISGGMATAFMGSVGCFLTHAIVNPPVAIFAPALVRMQVKRMVLF